MDYQRFSLLIGLILLAAGMSVRAGADSVTRPQGPVSVDTVMKAWKARQERTRSGRFVWSKKKTYAKGSLSSGYWSDDRPDVIPPEDTTVESTDTFIFDGIKLRYASDGHKWLFWIKDFGRQPYISVFDGLLSKSFSPRVVTASIDPARIPAASGTIHAKGEHPDRGNLYIEAPIITYRPLCPALSTFEPDKWEVSPEAGTLHGKGYVVLRKSHTEGRTEECWVDPDRDFLPVRCSEYRHDKLIVDLLISHRQDASGSWFPSEWRTIWLRGDGSVKEASEVRVTEHAINIPVDEREFQLEFPVGTTVHDLTSGRHVVYRVGESGLELMGIDPAKSGLRPPFPWFIFLATNVIAITLVASVWILLRKRSAQRGSLGAKGAKP